MLIPFYIFSHENSFPEYNSNEQKLEKLKAEYQVILKRSGELEQQGVIGAFDKRTIIDLSGGDMMRGALLETSAGTILNQGTVVRNSETVLI